MGTDGVVAGLAEKFAEFRPHADERAWRFYLGSEARAYARVADCGIAAAAGVAAAAAGVSRATVMAGAGGLADGAGPMPGRVRRSGAGRPEAEESQPGLRPALPGLLEAATRGDPVAAVTWTTLSLRDLERELAAAGFRCGKDAVARILHEAGCSLQGMPRVLEGRRHPGRDARFRRINAAIAQFTAAGDPVKARDHDFPDEEAGKVSPCGVYDIAANRGFVSAGTGHNTPAFAVNALRLWWRREGGFRYRGARRLLVTCDAGGSDSSVSRLWKDQLAVLAAETGLEITVAHFPPGTSKRNRTEHRLFCHITRTWKARPLMTREDAVAGIAATTTYQGLKCTAVLDDAGYPGQVKTSDRRMRYLDEHVLDRSLFHGERNCTVRPAAPREPEPAPEPGPGLEALAALAGIAGLPALLAAVTLPWQAAREQRLHLARGHPRQKASGCPLSLSLAAVITATACRHRLAMTYPQLSDLLGASQSTIRLSVTRLTPILQQHGITPKTPATTRPRQPT